MRAAVIAIALAGCTAIADFPADRLIEATDALCGNEVDDDGDGLTDCQDWKCLDVQACCTLPAIVLDDSFANTTCGALPDDARWEAWGAPYPSVCDGALVIGKDELCYPVGVISREEVSLQPSVQIEASVSGLPEPAAHLAIGIANNPMIIDGVDPCTNITAFPTLFGLVVVAGTDGVRFVATVEDQDLADVTLPAGSHRVKIRVEDDRAVSFLVDDVAFATTTDTVPSNPPVAARVYVRGLGSAARVDDVRVLAGTQCDRPDRWASVTPSTPFDPPADEATWDGFARGFANARVEGDTVRVIYAGCRGSASPICDPFSYAIAEAIVPSGQTPSREAEPLFLANDLTENNVPDLQISEAGDEAYWGRIPYFDTIDRVDLDEDRQPVPATVGALFTGTAGDWDELVSNPQVMQIDEHTRYLWYTAHTREDDRPRIGVAVSTDRGEFVRDPVPALDLGDTTEYAARGIQEPSVIYDADRELYRMWFTALGSFGRSSIGYAISTDGLHWSPYPGNPVISAEALGLPLIGSPAVVDDGGRLRMWIHGSVNGTATITIYELENLGVTFGSL